MSSVTNQLSMIKYLQIDSNPPNCQVQEGHLLSIKSNQNGWHLLMLSCFQRQFVQCFTLKAILIRICCLVEQWPTTFATMAKTAGANPLTMLCKFHTDKYKYKYKWKYDYKYKYNSWPLNCCFLSVLWLCFAKFSPIDTNIRTLSLFWLTASTDTEQNLQLSGVNNLCVKITCIWQIASMDEMAEQLLLGQKFYTTLKGAVETPHLLKCFAGMCRIQNYY